MKVVLFFLLFVICRISGQCTSGAVTLNGESFAFVPMPQEKCSPAFPACGVCNDALNTTGWTSLYISTSANFSDAQQAFALGYFEGFTTQYLIWQHFQNLYDDFWGKDNSTYPKIVDWLNVQYEWEQEQIANNKSDFWQQVSLTRLQQQGLAQGYADAAPQGQTLSSSDLLMMASISDAAMSLMSYMDEFHPKFVGKSNLDLLMNDHCTAIIKVTDTDIIVGETMWEDYAMMLRIFKQYSTAFANPLSVSDRSTFSSYPGTLMSLDDFYRLDTDLIVMETAISVLNKTMLQYVTNNGLLSWQRLLIANRISSNPSEWAQYFSTMSTGTFPVSWMALSIQVAPNNGTLAPNTLWVVEETPGQMFSADATATLQSQEYYASYNFPYFVEVWNRLGFPPVAKEYNMTYSDNPRANIIRARSPNVADVAGMQALIRYNDWQSDPMQEGSPGWGVSSRNDLPVYNCTLCSPSCFGGLDAKVSALSNSSVYAISGPSYENQPYFQWSTSTVCKNIMHIGQPDEWNFDWQEFSL